MRHRRPSPQTRLVLQAFLSQGPSWRHGYDLAKAVGLSSGTLYPILIRLHDRGLLEARWEPSEALGRPARHAYRLTSDGLATAGLDPAPKPRPARSRKEALA